MDQPIVRYLEDVIAAEKSFETQLRGFAKEATLPEAQRVFEQHAEETKTQYERLNVRLNELGGSISVVKSFLAHFLNMAPKAAQLGHREEERSAQDLMMAFAVENAELATYEALSVVADGAGDSETASLARDIQVQERETANKIWRLIPQSAVVALDALIAHGESDSRAIVIRYLQDAEAAERNFEDALSTFSKAGNQPEVQSLLEMMSNKARTQHERLQSRVTQLGGTRSNAKSVLAHLLAFAPLTAQMGHEDSEKNTQDLIITYSAAAAEMAMYEALGAVANRAGDAETAGLAGKLQSEEREDHRLAWEQLPQSARLSLQTAINR